MSDLTVTRVVNSVAVTGNSTEVVVEQAVQGVAVAAPGPQGPAGPAGPAGAAGGSVFLFTQSTPSATWVINHNVGRAVAVTLFDDDGNVVQSDIEHGTANQATVTWSSPTTGSALVI